MKRKSYIAPKAIIVKDDLGCILLAGSPKPGEGGKSITLDGGESWAVGDGTIKSATSVGGSSEISTDGAKENTVGWSDDWDF